jgi:molybdate transport system substrate-binding protein
VFAALLAAWPASAADLTVFAAASLRGALGEALELWSAEADRTVAVSYAGSSALARQIEAGAPADVFVSANAEWMDALEARGLILPRTRIDLVGNALVLVAGAEVAAFPLADLPDRLVDGRLAMALHDAVPAGIYGRQALTSLGIWEAVRDRVAQADNVRAALAYVATGEAPYGIVYASDAAAEPRVRVVVTFPPQSHDEITYPAAVVAGGDRDLATSLLDHLAGEASGAVFRRHGFTVP